MRQQGDGIGWLRLQDDTQIEPAGIGLPATTKTTAPATLLFRDDETAMRRSAACVLERYVIRGARSLDGKNEAAPAGAYAAKAFAETQLVGIDCYPDFGSFDFKTSISL